MTDVAAVAQFTSDPSPSPASSSEVATRILALSQRVSELLKRVADQEADNTKLQREKTEAKEKARDLHSRLTLTTNSLNDLTNSYAKRLSEKNDLVHENTTIEQYQTMLKEELTGHLRNICDLETRVQELEGKAEETKTEKNGLQERVKELETENETLRRQNRELEVSQGKRDTSEDVVQDTWNRNRDQGTTRRLGNGEAYTPRYGQDRNSQEDRHEERRRERDRREASGRMERDIYRPESRRDSERERDRGDRRRPSYNDRFDADQKPPLGPRVERR